MHVQDLRAFGYVDFLKQRIDDCQIFANEMNLSDTAGTAVQSSFNLPDQLTLLDLIGQKKYQKLRRIFTKAFGFELDFYRRLLPIIISNQLSEVVFNKEAGLSLDEYLSRYAAEAGKTVTGIESLAEQLEILQQIPLDYQLKSLLDLGRNVSKHRRHLLQLMAYYENSQLQHLYLSSKKGLGKMRKMMLYDRNLVMADRIAALLSRDTLFCAVGAAHLPGLKGVLKLLIDRGFKVRPVFPEDRP